MLVTNREVHGIFLCQMLWTVHKMHYLDYWKKLAWVLSQCLSCLWLLN